MTMRNSMSAYKSGSKDAMMGKPMRFPVAMWKVNAVLVLAVSVTNASLWDEDVSANALGRSGMSEHPAKRRQDRENSTCELFEDPSPTSPGWKAEGFLKYTRSPGFVCLLDEGGCFIVNGSQKAKVLISRERMENSFARIWEVRSASALFEGSAGDSGVAIKLMTNLGSENTACHGQLVRTGPYIPLEMPMVTPFQAVGVVADKRLLGRIVFDMGDTAMPNACRVSIEAAASINGQEDALDCMGQTANVEGPKAYFMGYMTKRLLSGYLGQTPDGDRDHRREKRIDLAGPSVSASYASLRPTTFKDARGATTDTGSPLRCAIGHDSCDGITCVNLQMDETHCPAGLKCLNGNCECPTTAAPSMCFASGGVTSSTCVDVARDPENCGTCGKTARQTCTAGLCQCPAGTQLCSGMCIHSENDPDKCGTCGYQCPTAQKCKEGHCKCVDDGDHDEHDEGEGLDAGGLPAGAICTTRLTDPNNCGSCDKKCPVAQVCKDGYCQCVDDSNQQLVNACGTPLGSLCVSFLSDNDHCGSCGNMCSPEQTCVGGVCQCFDTDESRDKEHKHNFSCGTPVGGFKCVSLLFDDGNCGFCGHECPAGQHCERGLCQSAAGQLRPDKCVLALAPQLLLWTQRRTALPLVLLASSLVQGAVAPRAPKAPPPTRLRADAPEWPQEWHEPEPAMASATQLHPTGMPPLDDEMFGAAAALLLQTPAEEEQQAAAAAAAAEQQPTPEAAVEEQEEEEAAMGSTAEQQQLREEAAVEEQEDEEAAMGSTAEQQPPREEAAVEEERVQEEAAMGSTAEQQPPREEAAVEEQEEEEEEAATGSSAEQQPPREEAAVEEERVQEEAAMGSTAEQQPPREEAAVEEERVQEEAAMGSTAEQQPPREEAAVEEQEEEEAATGSSAEQQPPREAAAVEEQHVQEEEAATGSGTSEEQAAAQERAAEEAAAQRTRQEEEEAERRREAARKAEADEAAAAERRRRAAQQAAAAAARREEEEAAQMAAAARRSREGEDLCRAHHAHVNITHTQAWEPLEYDLEGDFAYHGLHQDHALAQNTVFFLLRLLGLLLLAGMIFGTFRFAFFRRHG